MWEKSNQDQHVGNGATAAQAGRDVIINHGMSLAQMAEVIREVRNITDNFTAEAMVKVEARASEFEASVLRKFKDATKTNAEAFRDPDFQLMLSDAQKAYARSGDEAVKETLADIIARRSLAENQTRLALTLNDAAARAPKLTKTEFSILSLCYLARYTHAPNVGDPSMFAAYINQNFIPFADEILTELPAYWHIESQSCGRLATGQVELMNVWRPNYAGVLGKGLPEQVILDHTSEPAKGMILGTCMPCFRDATQLQPKALTREVYHQKYDDSGIPPADLDNVWNAFEATVPGGEDLYKILEPDIPEIRKLFEKWEETPIKQLELNSVGIAIGHANASRVVGLAAPLDIWIK